MSKRSEFNHQHQAALALVCSDVIHVNQDTALAIASVDLIFAEAAKKIEATLKDPTFTSLQFDGGRITAGLYALQQAHDTFRSAFKLPFAVEKK